MALAAGNAWLDTGANLLLFGPAGTGKMNVESYRWRATLDNKRTRGRAAAHQTINTATETEQVDCRAATINGELSLAFNRRPDILPPSRSDFFILIDGFSHRDCRCAAEIRKGIQYGLNRVVQLRER